MKFGGGSKFGSMTFGGDPYGIDPGYICDRMIASLMRFKKTPTAGCVGTIKRLAGEIGDQASLNRELNEGPPAFLVWYQGGIFEPGASTTGYKFKFKSKFSVICIAGDFRDQHERLEGRNRHDPSVDNLVNWATYFVTRECLSLNCVDSFMPINIEYVKFLTGQYIGIVNFAAASRIDIYDDEITTTLERLGIVHSPSDLNQLFEIDNTTPNTDLPSSIAGGVYELDA